MTVIFDPQHLPILPREPEAAIAQERLQADSLRQRFLTPPVWQPEFNQEFMLASGRSFRAAAVLLPLIVRADGLQVLLTERASHLQHHAGQISFPGGRVEADDVDAVATALREADEEIALKSQQVEVLGCLPTYLTGTAYSVTPVVALVHLPVNLLADKNEVADIFEVPLQFLMDGANHQQRLWNPGENQAVRSFYAMPYQDRFIWGATAGMLRNLFHFLRA